LIAWQKGIELVAAIYRVTLATGYWQLKPAKGMISSPSGLIADY
jgi:hypothetical protein